MIGGLLGCFLNVGSLLISEHLVASDVNTFVIKMKYPFLTRRWGWLPGNKLQRPVRGNGVLLGRSLNKVVSLGLVSVVWSCLGT